MFFTFVAGTKGDINNYGIRWLKSVGVIFTLLDH